MSEIVQAECCCNPAYIRAFPCDCQDTEGLPPYLVFLQPVVPSTEVIVFRDVEFQACWTLDLAQDPVELLPGDVMGEISQKFETCADCCPSAPLFLQAFVCPCSAFLPGLPPYLLIHPADLVNFPPIPPGTSWVFRDAEFGACWILNPQGPFVPEMPGDVFGQAQTFYPTCESCCSQECIDTAQLPSSVLFTVNWQVINVQENHCPPPNALQQIVPKVTPSIGNGFANYFLVLGCYGHTCVPQGCAIRSQWFLKCIPGPPVLRWQATVTTDPAALTFVFPDWVCDCPPPFCCPASFNYGATRFKECPFTCGPFGNYPVFGVETNVVNSVITIS